MLVSCLLIVLAGAVAAKVLGQSWMLSASIGLGLLLWTAVASTVGVVAALKALEKSPFVHVEDGKDDLFIDLKLGPFSYTITVPEAKGEDDGSLPRH